MGRRYKFAALLRLDLCEPGRCWLRERERAKGHSFALSGKSWPLLALPLAMCWPVGRSLRFLGVADAASAATCWAQSLADSPQRVPAFASARGCVRFPSLPPGPACCGSRDSRAPSREVCPSNPTHDNKGERALQSPLSAVHCLALGSNCTAARDPDLLVAVGVSTFRRCVSLAAQSSTASPGHSANAVLHLMTIAFQPQAGAVVRCDFRGMIAPEMLKMRDVVVIAKHKQNAKLVTVVPLSASAPDRPQPYHHQLAADPRPDGDSMHPIWAKCDMVYTVSLERLEMHYTRTRRGGRQSVRVQLPPQDFDAIRRCVAIALHLADNGGVPTWGIESGSAAALNQPGRHHDDK